jgi:hypothetical protein
MKISTYKNNAYTVFEKHPTGWYSVRVYAPNGTLHDKVLCDTYSEACAYRRVFNAIAKNM